ncbi:cation diffusion facilitator family transporter [Caulobacter sp. KR2-114]|uniref:cation diffusion facilitator family transporter n=1 Tax=Caulobacter sp. KR2-114 TaxID=3400912 RepID=UPI003BFFD2D7
MSVSTSERQPPRWAGRAARDGGSLRVILAALATNLAIAVIKLAAFFLTRSSAMLSEAAHSAVDSIDQVLLVVGERRGRREADETHPLGYGMEVYFWSFIVALMVFTLGGGAAIWEGVLRILHPEPLIRPWINYLVLAISGLLDGTSFLVGLREFRRITRGRLTLVQFLGVSKDPPLFATLIEDAAALIGLVVATAGITASAYFGVVWADGAASVAIGVLLVASAGFIANETRSLIAGESAAAVVVQRARAVVEADHRVVRIDQFLTFHLGPSRILVAATVHFIAPLDRAEVETAVTNMCAAIRGTDERIHDVFIRAMGGCET